MKDNTDSNHATVVWPMVISTLSDYEVIEMARKNRDLNTQAFDELFKAGTGRVNLGVIPGRSHQHRMLNDTLNHIHDNWALILNDSWWNDFKRNQPPQVFILKNSYR